MGASYVAFGDHDLAIDEIVHLVDRFAPFASTTDEFGEGASVTLEAATTPPPPLRQATHWVLQNISGCSSVLVGTRSFAVHPWDAKLYPFLSDLQLRDDIRRTSRTVAEVIGAHRLLFCTDLNADSDWDWVERGYRVPDVLDVLARDEGQQPGRWDQTVSQADFARSHFNPPFFLDEWLG